jgi:hypothetical protein
MTVIRPNSVSGINSITAQADEIKVFKSNGTQGGLIIGGANLNATTGISTILALNVTGNVSIAGTLTYQDVTNVDSIGIITARAGVNVSAGQLDVGSNIKIGNAGVITATSFSGSGANLTGLNTDLVNDTSPQLGGNLDTNSHEISLDTSHAINFGDSNELRVFYHSGNGQIDFNGTTSLQLKTPVNKYFQVVNRDDGNNILQAQAGGALTLHYNGGTKLATTNTGVTVTGTVTSDGLVMSDSEEIQLGNSTDVRIFHDSNNTFFKNLTGDLILNSSSIYLNNAAQSATMLKATQGADVSLYHNGTQEFRTTSYGISIGQNTAGSISGQAGIEIGKGHTTSEIRLKNTSGGSGSADGFGVQKWSDGNTYIYEYDPNNFVIGTNGVSRWIIGGTSGNLIPYSNNTVDIGTSTTRVRNIYTMDLHCSNKGSSNDVDGTWGDFTIQEGESDLFLINNRNGKKYKFNLTEVS